MRPGHFPKCRFESGMILGKTGYMECMPLYYHAETVSDLNLCNKYMLFMRVRPTCTHSCSQTWLYTGLLNFDIPKLDKQTFPQIECGQVEG